MNNNNENVYLSVKIASNLIHNAFNCISFIEELTKGVENKCIVTIYANTKLLKNIAPSDNLKYSNKCVYESPKKIVNNELNFSDYLYKLSNGNLYRFIFANADLLNTDIEILVNITNKKKSVQEDSNTIYDSNTKSIKNPEKIINNDLNKYKNPYSDKMNTETMYLNNPKETTEEDIVYKELKEAFIHNEEFKKSVKNLAEEIYGVINSYKKAINEQMPDWGRASKEVHASYYYAVLYDLAYNPNPESQHNQWMKYKIADGWSYGKEKNEKLKTHPDLVSYTKLPEKEKFKDTLFTLAFLFYSEEDPVIIETLNSLYY